MPSEVFTRRLVSRADVSRSEINEIGVGMLGYAFMGKAHSNGFRKIGYMTWPPPLRPRLVAIAGRNETAVSEAAERYGFERWTTDWQELVADPAIGLLDNLGPNSLHAEPTIAAAEAGKHVVCEKPLGRDADESYEIWRRVAATGVKHLCAFNYRFVPAVRLARELIDAGELGEIRHFRGRYLQDWGDTDAEVWRFDRAEAGSGALGDLAAHVVDLARYLVGDIDEVGGFLSTFIPDREVDDAVEATVRFANGAVGTLEATRLALGRRNAFQWEINGTKGSLAFDMERLNELQVFRTGDERTRGFTNVLVSEASHPFWEHWWPPGHIVGWGDTFVHELHHFLAAIAEDTDVAPHGATFEDGYRAAEVCDAIVRSGESGRREAGRRTGRSSRDRRLTSSRFVIESPGRHSPKQGGCSEVRFQEVIDTPRRSRRGRRRRRRRREWRDRAYGSDGLGMCSLAGHEVVGPVGAVRQARFRRRLQEGRRQGDDRQRAERPAEAALAGRAVHLERFEGRHHHVDRHRYLDRDPEEVHGRRWQDDRLRPPDRRRYRLRLRVVRRKFASAGSRLSV